MTRHKLKRHSSLRTGDKLLSRSKQDGSVISLLFKNQYWLRGQAHLQNLMRGARKPHCLCPGRRWQRHVTCCYLLAPSKLRFRTSTSATPTAAQSKEELTNMLATPPRERKGAGALQDVSNELHPKQGLSPSNPWKGDLPSHIKRKQLKNMNRRLRFRKLSFAGPIGQL